METTLFTFTGPSGAGKTKLYKWVNEQAGLNLKRVITCTTREKRREETDGVDYHFLSLNRFESDVARGEFVEHARVYNNRYGVKRQDIDAALEFNHGLLSVDIQGADTIKQIYGLRNVCIFISPRNIGELEARLRLRGDAEPDIRRRLKEAEIEMPRADRFDYKVINADGQFDYATQAIRQIILTRTI